MFSTHVPATEYAGGQGLTLTRDEVAVCKDASVILRRLQRLRAQ